MRIFADCADIAVMETLRDRVSGYTTNPALCRQAGVTDYETWGREVVARFPNHSLSIEVLADDPDEIRDETARIAEWGENVWVKVPVQTCGGVSLYGLIEDLAQDGARINVTAVLTLDQVERSIAALECSDAGIVSVFAGRIADTGIDPASLVDFVSYKPDNVELLWASTRETLNITQANQRGWDIITVPPAILAKYDELTGADLLEFSRSTVIGFRNDALAAGLTL